MSNLKKFSDKKKGFTLIELIVVIAIIGILAVMLLPRFTGFTDDARKKAAISEAKAVYTTLEVYYAQKGSYPPAGTPATKPDETVVTDPKGFDNIIAYTPKPATGTDTLFKYKSKDGVTVTCTADGTITPN